MTLTWNGQAVYISKQIAEMLGISYTSVSIHRKNNEHLFEEGVTHFKLTHWEMECFKAENYDSFINSLAYNRHTILYTDKGVKLLKEIVTGKEHKKEDAFVNQIQAFNYDGNDVRTVVKGNDVWFVAKDVCDVLGIGNPSDATKRLDDDEKDLVSIEGFRGVVNIINEPGLYSLVLGSKKKEAKQFKRWVTHEVLPSIRKHGAYMTDDVLEKSIKDPDYMIGVLTALKEEKQKRIEAEKTVNILTHVNKTYTATEIAKEIGFTSAKKLNADLQARKIQFNQNGTWVFYSKYADKGYVDIKQDVLDSGKVIYHRRFTQLGREFLLKLYDIKEA